MAPWDEAVVQPLRAVRRWLKEQDQVPRDQAAPLGRAVLAREIESEGIAEEPSLGGVRPHGSACARG